MAPAHEAFPICGDSCPSGGSRCAACASARSGRSCRTPRGCGPEPTATHVSGLSARCTGICVSWRSRSSRPCSSAPPPASTMPRSMMSAASSGGVLSSVDLIASMIWETGSSSARRTSSDEMTTVFGRPGQHVATPHLGLHLLGQPVARADLELDLLGRLLADEELVLLLDVVDDRVVHLVAADAERLRDDDAAERDHGDLGRAAADVDDHVPGRLADRQAGADRGRHRLLDQVGLARAGGERRVLDGALLDPVTPGGNADDHARVGKAMLVHLLDEVPQHLLGDVEVGDDAVLERAGSPRSCRACARASASPRHRRRARRRCAGRSRRRTAPRARCRDRARRRGCWRCRGRRPCHGRRIR